MRRKGEWVEKGTEKRENRLLRLCTELRYVTDTKLNKHSHAQLLVLGTPHSFPCYRPGKRGSDSDEFP